MVKLSIITINKNNLIGLEKTVKSIISQSFLDFEFIVIDGGSTDGSIDIIKKYQEEITYWVSESDGGIYNAHNKGIVKANGEYCLFLNSGDYLVDESVLEKVFTSTCDAAIIYGNMIIDWGSGKHTYGKMPNRITFHQMLMDTLWHPVSFIKRELFSKYGRYDEHFRIVADYDFFFRAIIVNNVSTQHIELDISVFDSQGISSHIKNKEVEMEERKEVLRKYFPPLVVDYLLETKGKRTTQASIYKRLINRIK